MSEVERLRLAIEHVIEQYPRFANGTDGGAILKAAIAGESWGGARLFDGMRTERDALAASVATLEAELVSTREQNRAEVRQFCDEKNADKAEELRLAARVNQLEAAIRFALGETDDWPARKPGEGMYHWRKELRRRAALTNGRT